MPEHLSPGVFVEEVSFDRRPIEPADTSTAAFVGGFADGPVDELVEVADAQAAGRFGPAGRRHPTARALREFFRNGGRRAVVVRAAGPSGPARRRSRP